MGLLSHLPRLFHEGAVAPPGSETFPLVVIVQLQNYPAAPASSRLPWRRPSAHLHGCFQNSSPEFRFGKRAGLTGLTWPLNQCRVLLGCFSADGNMNALNCLVASCSLNNAVGPRQQTTCLHKWSLALETFSRLNSGNLDWANVLHSSSAQSSRMCRWDASGGLQPQSSSCWMT